MRPLARDAPTSTRCAHPPRAAALNHDLLVVSLRLDTRAGVWRRAAALLLPSGSGTRTSRVGGRISAVSARPNFHVPGRRTSLPAASKAHRVARLGWRACPEGRGDGRATASPQMQEGRRCRSCAGGRVDLFQTRRVTSREPGARIVGLSGSRGRVSFGDRVLRSSTSTIV
jgi:hypothetical protein